MEVFSIGALSKSLGGYQDHNWSMLSMRVPPHDSIAGVSQPLNFFCQSIGRPSFLSFGQNYHSLTACFL